MIGTTVFLFLPLLLPEMYSYEFGLQYTTSDDNKPLTPKESLLAAKHVKEKWITQKVSQFDVHDNRTYQQRYFVNDQYFDKANTGPIFLRIHEGSGVRECDVLRGTWIGYASRAGALLISLEHRFYGQSRPFPNTNIESLSYLSAEQALRDTAHFVGEIKKTYPNNKLIVFGCSYGGCLSAWFRLKYSHLANGAVSSSAPLLSKVDFKEYYQVTIQSISSYDKNCVPPITDAFAELKTMLGSQLGRKHLTNIFNLCPPIELSTDPNDDSCLQERLANEFGNIVQANKIYASSDRTIDNLCKIMTNKTLGTPIERLVAFRHFESPGNFCFSYAYSDYINYFRHTEWEHRVNQDGYRPWRYQLCSQFANFQTSNAAPQVFGNSFPVDAYIKDCEDIFGRNYNSAFLNSAVKRTNLLYGGKNISVSRVAFVQGSVDPWHPLGITESNNPESPAIFVQGTAHCADVFTPESEAPLQLRLATARIERLIRQWIQGSNQGLGIIKFDD